MRRTWMSPLAGLLVLAAAAGIAGAADSPFEGTWKVLIPQKNMEVNIWLLKFDKEGKAVEVVAAINPNLKKGKVENIKGGEKQLSFNLMVASPMGGQQMFSFTLQPPLKDDKDSMRGTLRIMTNVIPLWLEKTENTEIDPKMASQPVGAFGDFEAAMKKEKADERIKELYEVGKSHLGRPVGLYTFDVLQGELNKAKAGPKEFAEYARESLKSVEGFGTLMQVSRNLQLANAMRTDKKLAGVALDCSRQAVKLASDDIAPLIRLHANLGLAASLIANDKKDEADKSAPAVSRCAEELVKLQKTDGAKLSISELMANTLLASDAPAIAEVGLEYARKTQKLIKEDAPVAQRTAGHRLVLLGLAKCGKADECGKVAEALRDLQEEHAAKVQATRMAAEVMLQSKTGKVADIGLEYARKFRKMLDEAPAVQKLAADKFLYNALKKRDKADEASKLEATIEKAEAVADKSFEEKNIPFKVEKFAGRKGKSKRVVLVELFTGAQCPPCVAADVAFDAAVKSYGNADVVFLQYHLHIPGPDALTNADSEARQQFYGEDVGGTPTAFVDGKVTEALGGGKGAAEASFEKLKGTIDKNLEVNDEGAIKLNVKRDGSKITVSADVSGLKESGAKTRLRIALVEEVVRFQGRNGQRLHHNVVRAFAGGATGFAMEKKEGKHEATIDLAELRKKLDAELTAFTARTSFEWPDRPLKLEKLKVIAFVQDDDGKRILQAVQADVPAK